jgi:hypothetical protein
LCPLPTSVTPRLPLCVVVSTGEFFTKMSSREALKDNLAGICPCKVVLEDKLQANFSHPVHQLLVDEGCFVSYVMSSQGALVKDSHYRRVERSERQ